jgi:HSP20 family protein
MFIMPIARSAHRRHFNGHARDFDRLFDDAVQSVFGASERTSAQRALAIDLRETEQAYSVLVDLPGVAKEDIKITIDGKRVSIEAGARTTPAVAEGERVVLRERSTVAFARSFTLPVEVDDAASQAKLELGVLSLTLPKKLKPASRIQVG